MIEEKEIIINKSSIQEISYAALKYIIGQEKIFGKHYAKLQSKSAQAKREIKRRAKLEIKTKIILD